MKASTIVAIEIASSKIKGAVATVDPAGTVNVVAVEEINNTDCVRHGRVQNVVAVSSAVNEIIRKLENNPSVAPAKISALVLPLGGRSMSGIQTSATLSFPGEIEITNDSVNRLKQEAIKDVISQKVIEDIIPRVFYVNNMEEKIVVGTYGKQLRGDFLLVACSNNIRQNLERIKWETIQPKDIRFVLRPMAVADLVLTASERQLGCMLVDFGAETTTVSIYKDGAPMYLATLPMGSRLITRDLKAGMSLTEERAEAFKISLSKGDSSAENLQEGNQAEINNYVHARAGEIAANIANQLVLAGLKASDLPDGIILTGGGAKLRDFSNMLAAQSKMKVRMASIPPTISFASAAMRTPDNIDVVALLAEAAKLESTPECLTYPPKPVIEIEPEPEPETEPAPQYEDAHKYTPREYTPREPERNPYTPASGRRSNVPGLDDPELLKDETEDLPGEANPHYPGHHPRGNHGASTFGGLRKKLNQVRESFVGLFGGMPEEGEDPDYEVDTDEDE
ncbi:MAG: pilus assembly protein PilM [Desulfovibrio sp.]|nr:pilus assembly protein PilM [Desulfovibrio sp.]